MTELVTLAAVRGEERIEFEVELHKYRPVKLVLLEGEQRLEFTGRYISRCLRELRLHFESKGWLLCCQGARPDVFPSGLLEDQSNGRLAYQHTLGRSVSSVDIVDILAPAAASQVGTVAEQDEFIGNFARS